jgi:dTMP kinase
MPPSLWEEPSEHAGALIAVEGADPVAAADYLHGIEAHLVEAGYLTTVVHRGEPRPVITVAPSADPLADALRASASLADLMTARIAPALESGTVVLCDGFLDELIVRYRILGLDENRLSRVAQWAAGGLKPDLTVLVNATEPAVAVPDGAAAEDGVDTPAAAAPPADDDPDHDDEDRIDPAQAFRDRASYTPERYLLVRPLSEEDGVINAEVTERIASVLRERSPARVEQEKVA